MAADRRHGGARQDSVGDHRAAGLGGRLEQPGYIHREACHEGPEDGQSDEGRRMSCKQGCRQCQGGWAHQAVRGGGRREARYRSQSWRRLSSTSEQCLAEGVVSGPKSPHF